MTMYAEISPEIESLHSGYMLPVSTEYGYDYIPFGLIGTALSLKNMKSIEGIEVFLVNGKMYPSPSTLHKIALYLEGGPETIDRKILDELVSLREEIRGIRSLTE